MDAWCVVTHASAIYDFHYSKSQSTWLKQVCATSAILVTHTHTHTLAAGMLFILINGTRQCDRK